MVPEESQEEESVKKAYIVIPHWCDDQSVYNHKHNGTPVYAETAGKAKYEYCLCIEDESEDWFKHRALRWPEMDLFPPKEHEIIKQLSKEQINKLKHTYGVESSSPGCRNYYNGYIDDDDLQTLVSMKLMVRNTRRDEMLTKGTTYFHLTDLGIEVAMSTRERLRGKTS